MRKECDDFVKQYAEQIIALLLKDLPPKEVCAALGLCSNEKLLAGVFRTLKLDPIMIIKFMHIKYSIYLGMKEVEVEQSVQCELCEQIVRQIESMIEKNKTEVF